MNRFDTPLDHGPVRLRLGAAAGALGVLFAAGRVMAASGFDENHVASALAWAQAHQDLVFLVNLCEMLSFSLIAFSCITLTGLVRGRGRWLTQVGGWGTAITYCAIAYNGSGVFIASLATSPDRDAAVDAVTRFERSGQAALLLVPLVSSILWPLLLGIGLWRAGLVGWWYAGLVLAWTVLEAAVNSTGLLALVGNVVPLGLVVAVWVRLLLDRARDVVQVPARSGSALQQPAQVADVAGEEGRHVVGPAGRPALPDRLTQSS